MRYRRFFFFKALMVIAFIAVLGLIVMRLWNWVIPDLVSGAHAIDYPRAIGLLVLSRILFGGFRGHGRCREHKPWHRWQRMTQAERDQLRNMASPASRPNPEAGA
ncbi:hypothetical protein [Paraburkholderia sp. J12]|uniref:hypothetical protein n=1 Tax=Paraburkholderia sp. J12 TaxID=2805432 RepID=UPI002ABD995C|nr:hypothetical protein [Paraburkholderia sp. J12]